MRRAPHGRGWVHYIVGVLLNAALFALVGPLIGSLAFGGALTLAAAPFSFATGYVIGSYPAALTGAATAIASSFIALPSRLYIFSALVGTAATIALNYSSDYLNTALYGVSGAVAAIVCTRLAKGLRLRAE